MRLVISVCAVAVFFASTAIALESPMVSSPGATDRALRIAEACPTFHWGAVADALEFDLVVYRLDRPTAELVLRERLPGSILAWAPSLDRCLAREGTFAWTIRAAGGGAHGAWSEPSLFQIAGDPSEVEIRAPLDVLHGQAARPSQDETVAAGRPEEPLEADSLVHLVPPSRSVTNGISSAEGAVTVGAEQIRVIRGVIAFNGGILAGEGFTVDHPAIGIYTVTFETPFASLPAVIATPLAGTGSSIQAGSLDESFATLITTNAAGVGTNLGFSLIAVGR